MLKPLSLTLSALLLSACGKTGVDAGTAANSSESKDGWTVYEDEIFRLEKPPKSEIFGPVDGKHDANNPGLSIEPAESEKTVIGAVAIQTERRYAGMLLRDAAASDAEDFAKKGGALLAKSQVAAKNGKCIGGVLRNPPQACPAVHFDPTHGTCYSSVYRSFCDDPKGNRWEVVMLMPSNTAKDALSPRARQQAAVYERILRSLEFKKS